MIGDAILGGLMGGLKSYAGSLEEERKREQAKLDREQLFEEFKRKAQWQQDFDMAALTKSAPIRGQAAAAQKRAEFEGLADVRAAEDAAALDRRRQELQQQKDIELNLLSDPRRLEEERRKQQQAQEQFMFQQRNQRFAPQQQSFEGLIAGALAKGDTQRAQEIADVARGMRGQSQPAKSQLRKINDPETGEEIYVIFDPNTQTTRPATIQDIGGGQASAQNDIPPAPPPNQRVVGKAYRSPSGAVAVWTGQGWDTGGGQPERPPAVPIPAPGMR